MPFFINKVFTDLMKSKRLTENDLKKIDIVLCQDAEQPFHKGNLHSLNGSFIGLPSSFSDSYTSFESHRSQNSTGETRSPENTRKTNQQNAAKYMQEAKSVLLEKNAIKYAIMKECLKTDSHDLQLRSTLQTVFVCFYAMVVQWSSVRFRRISFCLVYTGLWGALFGTVLSQQWSFYQAYLEEQADNDIVSLGKDYLEGGLSYYSRVLERNKMSKNRRQFDEEGNPKQRFFIKKCLSYTKKKEFFTEKLKEKEN